ncbi:ABC transporter substrate-binding protein [Roseibium porphyridii]|uniref:ABC transporter substrate-binding protein n=1 Tax=Roseibium porphyridii TaxID=2866279 RepID=A0ABY8F8V4_9HYPH|nr:MULTISPECIES: ABC transporter substrate-binding protein [Stappiaceae]QFT29297.1 Leucine-, isoleucine-, valine-, threonine-, and alanine-binding protein precursor [Labrenzia sp. THAF82]WFE90285.1 ABC transporter substrate-binding protein [Roseibium sp. KMA01]
MLSKSRKSFAAAMAATCLFAFGSANAEDGVSDAKILFGQAAALEGPAGALGTGMKLGIEAAFAEANAAGGVHGRMVELVSMDDGYEPDRSIAAVNKLINDNKVFSLIGPVGTPTSKATQPIATAAKVPFVGPFTGAGFLRDPAHGNIVNVRATYGAETEAWIEHLNGALGLDKIAILYQDDGFGRVGLAGVQAALEKRGLELVAEGTYQRNTTAVKSALLEIRKAKPQAVVMVGAYKPIAEFIKLAKKVKLDAEFVNISFVGSKALSAELGDAGEGVIISQVVPFPWDVTVPLVKEYQAALKAKDASAEPGFVSLEGYIVGRLAVMGLEKAGKDVTREGFLDAFWSTGAFDLGGVTLTFGADDNQGMDDVFLTTIQKDGSFAPIDKPAS